MSAASSWNINSREYRQIDWCVEMLSSCLVGDTVVIDEVGHLATAFCILLVEQGPLLGSALCAHLECALCTIAKTSLHSPSMKCLRTCQPSLRRCGAATRCIKPPMKDHRWPASPSSPPRSMPKLAFLNCQAGLLQTPFRSLWRATDSLPKDHGPCRSLGDEFRI